MALNSLTLLVFVALLTSLNSHHTSLTQLLEQLHLFPLSLQLPSLTNTFLLY